MAREIKFRAWSADDKKMYYVNGGICHLETGGDHWGVFETPYRGSSLAVANNNFGDKLMQYTGSKDKNGKEIYEGDICKCIDCADEEYQTVVEYDDGAFTVEVNGCDYDYTAIGWALKGDINDIEVIGNIYENPELLEEGGQGDSSR